MKDICYILRHIGLEYRAPFTDNNPIGVIPVIAGYGFTAEICFHYKRNYCAVIWTSTSGVCSTLLEALIKIYESITKIY